MSRSGLRTILTLLMSVAAFGYAQQASEDSGSRTQQQPNQEHPTSPPSKAPESKPPHSTQQVQPPKQPPTTKPPNTERPEIPQSSKEQPKPVPEQHGTSTRPGTQPGKARPEGKSARIPDPQFRANFGRQHTFAGNRVITTTKVVPNQTRFVFVGYTFIFLDPWPADWLFTDECYIDNIGDQYFLVDVLHPGERVALFVEAG